MSDELTLAAEFPAATREQWLELVDKVLKGAPFDRKLVTTTADGIALQPLYTADMVATAHDEAGFPGAATWLSRVSSSSLVSGPKSQSSGSGTPWYSPLTTNW